MDRGSWRPSPALDINPFPDRARELKTWISEETGPAASIDALVSVAEYFRISDRAARTMVREVENAVSARQVVRGEIGMTPLERDAFADAFEHEEREVARAV